MGTYLHNTNILHYIISGHQLNKCYNVFEYRFENCLFGSYSPSYDFQYNPVICNFFTFYWTPDKNDQTCLTMTYFTNYEFDDKPFFITMDINDENNNMLLSSTGLEQYVLLFAIESKIITNLYLKVTS